MGPGFAVIDPFNTTRKRVTSVPRTITMPANPVTSMHYQYETADLSPHRAIR